MKKEDIKKIDTAIQSLIKFKKTNAKYHLKNAMNELEEFFKERYE